MFGRGTPSAGATPKSPSLYSSIRDFSATVLSVLHTRADLATLELEEQAMRALRLALVGFGAVLCVSALFFFLMLLLVVVLWPYSFIVLSVICFAYFVASLVLIAMTRQLVAGWPRFLEQTLAELKRDVDHLKVPLKREDDLK